MRKLGMHTAVTAQAHQMEPLRARMAHGIEQDGILKEFAGGEHAVDARDVHVNHAAGADVEVPHFAVAHLSFGKSDEWARGVDQRVGKIAQQHVVSGLARGGDSVTFLGSRETPAIQNGENERAFRAVHYWWKAFRPAKRAASPNSSSMRRS